MMYPGWSDYVREWIRLPFLLIAERMDIWTSIDGQLRVAAITGSDDTDQACVERIQAALRLIRDYAPHRYARVVVDLKRIVVFTGRRDHIRATYTKRLRTCLVDATYVLRQQTSSIDIAGTILHEATHARLGRSGVPHIKRLIPRIEQACLKEELRFYENFNCTGKQIADAQRLFAAWRARESANRRFVSL